MAGISRMALTCALALLATTLTPVAEAARIKCWTNKDGVRECGNVVPPEYAQKGHEEVSRGGLTVDRQEAARSAAEAEAERRQQAAAEAAATAERRRFQAQSARDRVLTDTYVSESDMLLAHRDKLDAIDSRIRHSREHIGKLEETLHVMQRDAANLERSGKSVPDKLLSDMREVRRQIDETERFITAREDEKLDLNRQHEEDLRRFRYLKAGGAIGSEQAS